MIRPQERRCRRIWSLFLPIWSWYSAIHFAIFYSRRLLRFIIDDEPSVVDGMKFSTWRNVTIAGRPALLMRWWRFHLITFYSFELWNWFEKFQTFICWGTWIWVALLQREHGAHLSKVKGEISITWILRFGIQSNGVAQHRDRWPVTVFCFTLTTRNTILKLRKREIILLQGYRCWGFDFRERLWLYDFSPVLFYHYMAI